MKHLIRSRYLIALTVFLLSSCTTIPEQLEGEYTSLIPKQTTEENLQTAVRWGGVLLETKPEKDHTCFEILSRQLEKSMRPGITDQSDGRFIACKPGFYDPEIFRKGREVTLTGKIIHMDIRKIDEYDYQFPIVDIEFMSLWPRRFGPVYYRSYRPYYWHYPPYGFHYRYRY